MAYNLDRLRYIVPVAASRALLLLDGPQKSRVRLKDGPEIGALLAIDIAGTVVLAVISALTGQSQSATEDPNRRSTNPSHE